MLPSSTDQEKAEVLESLWRGGSNNKIFCLSHFSYKICSVKISKWQVIQLLLSQ